MNFILLGLIILFTIYIIYRAQHCEVSLFSVSLIALFAGLFCEILRISDNWKDEFYRFVGSYFVSFIAFLPGKHESHYRFENHIFLWPYYFLFIYTLFSVFAHRNKVTAKLTEGSTLVLSISFIYWILDYGFENIDNWFVKILLIIGLVFTLFSYLNALTNIHLSKKNRLILSLGSTIIMLAFAIDNIIRVYKYPAIESTTFLTDELYIGFKYFLLGISAVYILNNLMLLTLFLPEKKVKYQKTLSDAKEAHLNRYSENQVHIGHAIFAISYTVILYVLNYNLKILPRHTMIWFVFLTFPLILNLYFRIKGKVKSS